MNHEKIFSRYIVLADVLGQMFQNVLEVVIHDLRIWIMRSFICQRPYFWTFLWGPISEINLRRLLEQDEFPDTLVNFASRNPRGQKLKSSSLAIEMIKEN